MILNIVNLVGILKRGGGDGYNTDKPFGFNIARALSEGFVLLLV